MIILKTNLAQTDGTDYNVDLKTRKEKERETSKFLEEKMSE